MLRQLPVNRCENTLKAFAQLTLAKTVKWRKYHQKQLTKQGEIISAECSESRCKLLNLTSRTRPGNYEYPENLGMAVLNAAGQKSFRPHLYCVCVSFSTRMPHTGACECLTETLALSTRCREQIPSLTMANKICLQRTSHTGFQDTPQKGNCYISCSISSLTVYGTVAVLV